jgi:hypothetical protein
MNCTHAIRLTNHLVGEFEDSVRAPTTNIEYLSEYLCSWTHDVRRDNGLGSDPWWGVNSPLGSTVSSTEIELEG